MEEFLLRRVDVEGGSFAASPKSSKRLLEFSHNFSGQITAQKESTCFKGILTCALFLKSRDFRDIKNYIRERFPKKEGEKLTNHR